MLTTLVSNEPGTAKELSMNAKATIAIVNNERNIVTSLRMELEAEGFMVRVYADTASALALLEEPADLALLDKTNPPIGGIELFKRLRARHRMPVIFLSAWAEELEEEFKDSDLEAEGYIPTPFSQRLVIARIREVLARRLQRSSIALVSPRSF